MHEADPFGNTWKDDLHNVVDPPSAESTSRRFVRNQQAYVMSGPGRGGGGSAGVPLFRVFVKRGVRQVTPAAIVAPGQPRAEPADLAAMIDLVFRNVKPDPVCV